MYVRGVEQVADVGKEELVDGVQELKTLQTGKFTEQMHNRTK